MTKRTGTIGHIDHGKTSLTAALVRVLAAGVDVREHRPCTCHPDDNPPRPCPRRYAYGECVKAADCESGDQK